MLWAKLHANWIPYIQSILAISIIYGLLHSLTVVQRGDPAPGTFSSGIVLVGDKIGPGLQITNNQFGGGSIFHTSSLDQVGWEQTNGNNGGNEDNCSARFNISIANQECEGLKQVGIS